MSKLFELLKEQQKLREADYKEGHKKGFEEGQKLLEQELKEKKKFEVMSPKDSPDFYEE